MLQLHQLFPTVVATTQLPLDPLQQASCMQALLRLRGETEGNPSEGCAWTGDLHGAVSFTHLTLPTKRIV